MKELEILDDQTEEKGVHLPPSENGQEPSLPQKPSAAKPSLLSRLRRRRRRWPHITLDLARREHRTFLLFSVVSVAIVVAGTLIGGYETDHYTESSEF